MIGNRCVLLVFALDTIESKNKNRHLEKLQLVYSLVPNSTCIPHKAPLPRTPFPAPLYAVQSLLTASVTPTSLVSNEYSATPTSAVPARRAQLAAARVLGTRFLGK